MQNFQKISLIIFLLSLVTGFSCKEKLNTEKRKTYKVKLAFEPDFYNESSIDTVIFSKPQLKDTSAVGDELKNFVSLQFFKVEGGELIISAISVFERTYSKTIDIQSDTTLIFYKKDFPLVFERKDKWDKSFTLKSTDTVVIIYSNYSCATTPEFASVRKISCFKSDSNFAITYSDLPRGSADMKSSYKTKKLDNKFMGHLVPFYYSAKKVAEAKQKEYCTTSSTISVRVGNRIFNVIEPFFSFKKNPQFLIGKLYDDLMASVKGR
jgi:hypothetical protein